MCMYICMHMCVYVCACVDTCALGCRMLIPVQTIVEQQGVGVLSQRDDKGHTPAHWACLGGHTSILRFIIENKVSSLYLFMGKHLHYGKISLSIYMNSSK